MADDVLFKMVFPNSDPGLSFTVSVDSAAIRQLTDEVVPLADRLTLASIAKENLGPLAQKASPWRFERADIALRFLRERPERGDAKLWQDATEKDAGLGEAMVLVDPLVEWTDLGLAVSLADLTVATGHIERTVDALAKDSSTAGDVSPFRVADIERKRLDDSAAGTRARVDAHLETGADQARLTAQEDTRALAARSLKEADPKKILQSQKPLKLKK